MIWFIVLLALAATYIMYRQSQSSAAVPVELGAAAVDGELSAIEYFWRPG